MYPFLKIYQSNLPSLSHGLPSFLWSETALLTNFKSSAAMRQTVMHVFITEVDNFLRIVQVQQFKDHVIL